jgi:hypothetical protein
METKLSSSITVNDYRKLEAAGDKKAIGEFIYKRFDERYFSPILSSSNKHGFTMMAIGCLVIETLESFYQGKKDSGGRSKKMFSDFLKRDTGLRIFSSEDDWFYFKVRCGILHQAEVIGGWRIIRSGDLLNSGDKTINAEKFIQELQKILKNYEIQLQTDELLWSNFKLKMDAICQNCQNPQES